MSYKSTLTLIASLAVLSGCGGQVSEAVANRLDIGTDISNALGPATNPKRLGSNIQPAADYAKQYWVHPNACSYSRAQAPGYKPTWHLILNPYHIGQPPAHAGCAMMITQDAWSGGYMETSGSDY